MERVDTIPHQLPRLLDMVSSNLRRLALMLVGRLKCETHNRLFRRAPKQRHRRPWLVLGLSPVLVVVTGELCSHSLFAAPIYVQGTYSAPQTSQTTVSVPYSAAQGAGNLKVVIVGWNDTTNIVSSVTDPQGNTSVAAPEFRGERDFRT
jgi:hypothetical protein